jgi:hypothetical protein
MTEHTAICTCGQTAVALRGRPIHSVVCYCESCRTAAQQFARDLGAPTSVTADGGVAYCLWRKDRAAIARGGQHLREHRLKPDSPTRRLVAECCGAPMFVDYAPGHWLTVFRDRLPDAPPTQAGIMAGERPEGPPPAYPLYKTFAPRLMIALLLAWAAMGFRRPKVI